MDICFLTLLYYIFQTNEDKTPELLLNAGRESAMSDYLAGHMVPLPDFSLVATESEEDGNCLLFSHD